MNRGHRAFAGLFLALLSAASAGAQDRLTVGSASASRGEVASGWLEVAAAADPGTRIPVSVVHGPGERHRTGGDCSRHTRLYGGPGPL